MIKLPTCSYVIDSRRSLTNGNFPVKIRITYQRVSRLYSIREGKGTLDLSKSDYSKLEKHKTSSVLAAKRKLIRSEINRAESIIETISRSGSEFTFKQFEISFRDRYDIKSVGGVFQLIIDEKMKAGRAGTSISYRDALHALDRFKNSKEILFKEITVEFLMKYEKHLLAEGKSINSVGVYMRSLRVAYNRAVHYQLVNPLQYPFGKFKYTIPKETTRKRALTKAEIKSIYSDFTPLFKSQEWYAKNYFMLSYLCNGMNFRDIAELTTENVDTNWIRYYRTKTKMTSMDKKLIQIFISPELRKIMNDLSAHSGKYFFPILSEGMDEYRKKQVVNQLIKTTNKYLKKIALELGITNQISTYYARHTWATVQKRNGASIELISDSLGHHSTNITQVYLDSFDEDTLRSLNADIL